MKVAFITFPTQLSDWAYIPWTNFFKKKQKTLKSLELIRPVPAGPFVDKFLRIHFFRFCFTTTGGNILCMRLRVYPPNLKRLKWICLRERRIHEACVLIPITPNSLKNNCNQTMCFFLFFKIMCGLSSSVVPPASIPFCTVCCGSYPI